MQKESGIMIYDACYVTFFTIFSLISQLDVITFFYILLIRSQSGLNLVTKHKWLLSTSLKEEFSTKIAYLNCQAYTSVKKEENSKMFSAPILLL